LFDFNEIPYTHKEQKENSTLDTVFFVKIKSTGEYKFAIYHLEKLLQEKNDVPNHYLQLFKVVFL
jgi:hypothetical protein